MLSNINSLHYCRVCGMYYPDYFPYGEDGLNPSYDFCDCCGVEWGNPDFNKDGAIFFRKKWLLDGAKWNNLTWRKNNPQPQNWNLIEQLKQIPQEYRDEYLEEYIKNYS